MTECEDQAIISFLLCKHRRGVWKEDKPNTQGPQQSMPLYWPYTLFFTKLFSGKTYLSQNIKSSRYFKTFWNHPKSIHLGSLLDPRLKKRAIWIIKDTVHTIVFLYLYTCSNINVLSWVSVFRLQKCWTLTIP